MIVAKEEECNMIIEEAEEDDVAASSKDVKAHLPAKATSRSPHREGMESTFLQL